MRPLLSLIVLVTGSAMAEDWPQYRGPNRDDVSAEKGLLTAWPKEGPPLIWTYGNAGVGYSGPAVVGNRLYTLGGRGDDEFLIALDLESVKDGTVSEAWAAKVGPTFQWTGNHWSAGPSTTPTVDGELTFALGGMGDLLCVEMATGAERWRKNLPADLKAEVNPIGGGPKKLGWGYTGSPLIDGDRLICIPGGPLGTVAALDKKSGDVLWRSADVTDQAAYTSPMAAEIDGVRQYVVLTNRGLLGVAANNGKLLWSYRRNPPYGTEVVNSPIVRGNLIYATVGAGQGCDLIRVVKDGDEFKTETVYANKNLANHHGNVVLVGDHVFGFSESRGWTCQKFDTGETLWSERRRLPGGAVTYADGRLYCYSENDGTVALVEASPTAWMEQGRFKIPQQSMLRRPRGKIWTPPVVSGGRLFLRDQELIFCFNVAAPLASGGR
jgi:outer membrane protein assembly factor BamB